MSVPEDYTEQTKINCFCGICVKNKNTSTIIEHQVFDGRPQSFAEVIYYCFNIQIQSSSYGICRDCINSLSFAYTFKRQIENSLGTITEHLDVSGIKEIKEEVIENDYKPVSGNEIYSDSKVNILNLHRVYEKEIDLENRQLDAVQPVPSDFSYIACERCEEVFTERKKLLIHLELHPACNKNFHNDLSSLKSPELKCLDMKSDDKVLNFKCSECGKLYSTKSILTKHIREIHRKKNIQLFDQFENNAAVYQCSLCPKRYLKIYLLFNHYYSRHEKSKSDCKELVSKDYKYYECSECQVQYAREDSLLKHNRIIHVGFSISKSNSESIQYEYIECDYCRRQYKRKDSLIRHLRQYHSDVRNRISECMPGVNDLTCKICDETFPFHKNLMAHMTIHFPNFVCDICGKVFLSRNALSNHAPVHNLPHTPCPICNKKFKSDSILKRHVENHKARPLRQRCRKCPMRFNNYPEKRRHMVEVHNEQPIYYKCHFCPKQFNASGHLGNHIRSFHLQERKRKCDICDSAFFSKSSLDSHTLIHTKVKDFKCEICSKAFSRKYCVTQHMRTHRDK